MPLQEDSLWYKEAVIYELHVRSFHDSSGAGCGDFLGLTKKLDYLEDLGVTAIWLLPFYPSPLKDDGYDIADYTDVNPDYGTLGDFRNFLDEAHRRGLRVITELVLNHTSDRHPWFQRARRAPKGSAERDFYMWSDSPEKYSNVPILFPDFETSNWTWDPVAKAYYWHRFYSHQPDLNYDNSAVVEAVMPIVDFWFGLGVDGMRLDAVPYLFAREGTSCEHLPETHAFLKSLRKHVDERFKNRMFLAEANAWPEEAVDYFGSGDECQMAFHFPLMPRLFMALHREDRFPILDIIAQTPSIPATAQWCLFLRNHDELTLAMVTDEERDYMYRAYAEDGQAKLFLGIRHRLAPLLKNDRRRIELMNALLFSLPGTPVVYYGDELGMGDNIYLGDRNGVRTPMQWSADRNAGFSRANPQKLFLPVIIDPEYHFEAINVEAQQNNPSSLLWWMKRLIALRKRHHAFGLGSIEFLASDNPKVLTFVRKYEDERILVVANLSRFVQYVNLEAREFEGVAPEELFGRSRFPTITSKSYLLTLGPHAFYWFSMNAVGSKDAPRASVEPPILPILKPRSDWRDLSAGGYREELEGALPRYLSQRMPGGSRGEITVARIAGGIPLYFAPIEILLLRIEVEYRSGMPEIVTLPLAKLTGDAARSSSIDSELLFARLGEESGELFTDALAVPEYCESLLRAIHAEQHIPTADGVVSAHRLNSFELGSAGKRVRVGWSARNNNHQVEYDSQFILQTFRRLEEGINPDIEFGKLPAFHDQSSHAAELIGYLEWRRRGRPPISLSALHRYIPNQGSARRLAIDQASALFEQVAAMSREMPPARPTSPPIVGPTQAVMGETAAELFAASMDMARRLGRITAEMHTAAARSNEPGFAVEPFDAAYQRSLFQSFRTRCAGVFEILRRAAETFIEVHQEQARALLALRDQVSAESRGFLDQSLRGKRIRCHGDFHLGQLLNTGNDFVVKDFVGDSRRSIGERRIKKSPLWDAAAMIRSFDYASGMILHGFVNSDARSPGHIRGQDRDRLVEWAESLHDWTAREYASSYIGEVSSLGLLPETSEGIGLLLRLLILEKSLQELEYDLEQRPNWSLIPINAILRQLSKNHD